MFHNIFATIRVHVARAFSERGASMVEYSLLVALIAMIAFAALQLVGDEVSTAYSGIADSFTTPN